MKVDLPAPLGPVRPYLRPDENVVLTSSNSTFEPNRMDTPLTEITHPPLLEDSLWRGPYQARGTWFVEPSILTGGRSVRGLAGPGPGASMDVVLWVVAVIL